MILMKLKALRRISTLTGSNQTHNENRLNLMNKKESNTRRKREVL